jgi:REP element-mobilizing transposase RayT
VSCREFPRSALPDGTFHVTARALAGLALFVDDADRSAFLSLLRRTASRFGWTCHAYCLMTTHYHLLVETQSSLLSKGMHRINGIYAQRYNELHGRAGHLFGQRFSAYALADDVHLTEAARYVLDNPVRAGICVRSDEWPWSGLALEPA